MAGTAEANRVRGISKEVGMNVQEIIEAIKICPPMPPRQTILMTRERFNELADKIQFESPTDPKNLHSFDVLYGISFEVCETEWGCIKRMAALELAGEKTLLFGVDNPFDKYGFMHKFDI